MSGPVAMIVGPDAEGVDPLAHDLIFGWLLDRRVISSANASRSTASAEPAGTLWISAAAHDQAAERAHFLVEQADGIVLGIVGAETVGADHFGQPVAVVGRRRVAAAAHFAEADLRPASASCHAASEPARPPPMM